MKIDYTGQIIGKYKVLSFDKTILPHYHTYYNVQCIEHGTIKSVRVYDIIKRSGNYCRCKDFKSSKDICLDQLYQRYKYGSSKRHNKTLEFNLEKEYFIKLVQSNCFYCDKVPKQKITVNKKHSYLYNGIDRLNNTKGYEKNNVVACCWDCNQMKSNLNFNEFIEIINKISNKFKEKIES